MSLLLKFALRSSTRTSPKGRIQWQLSIYLYDSLCRGSSLWLPVSDKDTGTSGTSLKSITKGIPHPVGVLTKGRKEMRDSNCGKNAGTMFVKQRRSCAFEVQDPNEIGERVVWLLNFQAAGMNHPIAWIACNITTRKFNFISNLLP